VKHSHGYAESTILLPVASIGNKNQAEDLQQQKGILNGGSCLFPTLTNFTVTL